MSANSQPETIEGQRLLIGSAAEDIGMAQGLAKRSVEDIKKLLEPYVLVGLIGLLLRAAYPERWIVPDLAHALSDALMVAATLGAVIELASAKRLIEHVSEDLAGLLVGRGLPRELQEVISGIVFRTNVVLLNYLKVYRIQESDEPGYFTIEITTSYEAANYSEATVSYKPHMYEESIYRPQFMRLEYRTEEQSFACTAEELRAMAASKPGSEGRNKGIDPPDSVKLLPARDDPQGRGRCKVLWTHVVRMNREYSDVTAFGAPTLGITIRFDAHPPNVSVCAGGPGMKRDPKSETWATREAFMPNGHVRAWWFTPPAS